MSTTSPCVHGSPLGSCFFCQHTKPIYPDLYSSIPAQPLAADTSPTGWDAGYETLKVLPGDVLTAHEYLARCKEIPAQPASTLDTSPPSRTSNAASENGAASLLALIESVDKYFSITNRMLVEITMPEWQLIKSALQQVHPIAPPPLSEPAIRAAVYDCTDAQCVCGRCGPIKIAVDCSIERVLR